MGVAENRTLLAEQGIEGFLRRIGGEDYVRTMSIALAHFCFRNGPVEDMHADPSIGLTDAHMKTLNKYMVDKLGLFIACLACEDDRAILRMLSFHLLCGSEWDSPDLRKELIGNGFDPNRLETQKRLLESVNTPPGSQTAIEMSWSGVQFPDSNDDSLKPCPFCGSELLECKDETHLARFVDRSDLGTNRAVAEAAGVPVHVVSELQHCVEEKLSETRKRQAQAIADCLGVPTWELLSQDPARSKVRCLECGATASLSTWNMRA